MNFLNDRFKKNYVLNFFLFCFKQEQQQYTYKTGIRLVVHNQSIHPFIDEEGIDVSTGEETQVAMTRTFYKSLPKPYSSCLLELNEETARANELLEILNANFSLASYTQTFCMKVCYQNYIVGKFKFKFYKSKIKLELIDLLFHNKKNLVAMIFECPSRTTRNQQQAAAGHPIKSSSWASPTPSSTTRTMSTDATDCVPWSASTSATTWTWTRPRIRHIGINN